MSVVSVVVVVVVDEELLFVKPYVIATLRSSACSASVMPADVAVVRCIECIVNHDLRIIRRHGKHD
jgi:hypothetical protein